MRPALIVLLFLLTRYIVAQDYRALVYPAPAVNEGVSTSLIQTPDGFMWFGLYGALAAYDGTSYRYFTYSPDDSTSVTFGELGYLTYDPTGFIWAGSSFGGVSALDLRTGKCTNYYSDPTDAQSIAGNKVSGITIDRARSVWVTTNNFAVTRIDSVRSITVFHPPLPGSVQDYDDAGSLRGIVEDRELDGVFWVNSAYGLYKFEPDNNTFELFLPGAEIKPEFFKIVQDDNGRLWLSTFGQGLVCYDPKANSWKQIKAVRGAQETRTSNLLLSMIHTSDNQIIGMSAEEGMWILDANADSVSLYMIPDEELQFHFRGCHIILRDERGDIWTGYRRLIRLTKRQAPFQSFLFDPPLTSTKSKGNWQREFVDDPHTGNFFVGTLAGDGLLECNIETGEVTAHRYRSIAHPDRADVQMEALAIAGDTGVWIGSKDGLLYHDKATGQVTKVDVTDKELAEAFHDFVRDLGVDEAGNLWLACDRMGLVRWSPKTGAWKQYLYPIPANSGSLRSIRISSDGSMWLAFSHDVALLDPVSGKTHFLPHRRGDEIGLSLDVIRDIEIDPKGDLWVSTVGGGINRVTRQPNGSFTFRYYSTADGLPTEFIYDLAIGTDGRVWAGTRVGIAVIDPGADVVTTYRVTDGLEFARRSGALHQLASGEIVSSAQGGFHFAHPDSLLKRSVVPRPYLYNLETADESLLLSFAEEIRLRIGPYDNFFNVTWGAVSFEETPKTRFAYMLDGFDNDWVIAGERSFARYAKLPGGNYTFRLKAMNDRGEWSQELATLHIQVNPPFTKTAWFYILIGLIAVALLYLFYRLRVNRIRHESRLREQFERDLAQVEMQALRAQMNPHFLFNSLNSIDRFTVRNDPKSASKYLTRFSRLIRLILDNSKSSKVSLANELEAIKLYVELESLRFDDKFNFSLNIDEAVEPENIEIDSMILQPYIENAIWHGLMHKDGHGLLSLSVTRENSTLKCVVEDNGVGRKKAAELKSKSAVKEKSYGMKITSDRIRMLNQEKHKEGSVTVTDLEQNGTATGTRVEISLPC